ncbi:SH3 domain-containing protein [Salipiger sp.]|uniref:SH3 domain-containing protein n=1 Tax=Salipiger sp. TaxID=2078585 RepID=UPI003A9814FB
MYRSIIGALVLSVLAACQAPGPGGLLGDRYEVHGVGEGDMLKLRAGPGTGFDVRVGLPNGEIVRVRDCSRLGGTRWCRIVLDRSPGLEGYVSQTYLRKL